MKEKGGGLSVGVMNDYIDVEGLFGNKKLPRGKNNNVKTASDKKRVERGKRKIKSGKCLTPTLYQNTNQQADTAGV